MHYSTTYQSPIGKLVLAGQGDKLIGLWLNPQKYDGSTVPKNMIEKNNCPIFVKTKKWLDKYFAGKKPSVAELSLAPIGGKFRQEVWKILLEIPYGKTITYGDIAQKIAAKMGIPKMASQAIGGAVGHNPISIIIPCHRVIGAHGNLTGYGGGIKTKIKLLELEGVDMTKLFMPKKPKH